MKVDGNSRDSEDESSKEPQTHASETLRLELGCLLISVNFRILLTVALRKAGLSPEECAGTGMREQPEGSLSQPGSQETAREKERCQHIMREVLDLF